MTSFSTIGIPLPVVIVRVPATSSTSAPMMPGNHSGSRPGSPIHDHTSSAGAAMRTSRRTLPLIAVTTWRR